MSGPRASRPALAAFAAFLPVLLAGCDELGEPVLLNVASRAYTARDLREIHAEMEASARPSLATREEREAFVSAVVERVLLEEYGESLLAQGRADIDEELEGARDDLLIRRLRVVLGTGAPLDSVAAQEAYERMKVLHRVRVVAFATEEDANRAKGTLRPGEGLDALPEYARAGAETWIAWSPAPDPIAEALDGHAIGDVIGPVPSRTWWRLVEPVGSRPAEIEPYDRIRGRILGGLRARAEAVRSRELLDRLFAEKGARIVEERVEWLASLTREAILRPGVTEGDADWAVPDVPEAERETVLAEWEGGRWTAADHVRVLLRMSRGQRPRASGMELAIRDLVEDGMERRLLVAEAKRRGLEDDWYVRQSIDADRKERVIRLAIRRIEQDAVDPAENELLMEALRESQPQLLRTEPRARLLRLDLPTRELAEEEARAVTAAGGGRERLREILSSSRPMPGSYHLLESNASAIPEPAVRDAVFGGAVDRPLGPYEAVGGWFVLVCLEVAPPRDIEAAELATASAGTSEPEVLQSWIRKRRDEVGVVIHRDALDELGPGG